MTQSKHTPTPWYSQPAYDDDKSFTLYSEEKVKNGGNIKTCIIPSYIETYKRHAEANAAFIVKAVNNHEALIAALAKIMTISAHMKSDRAGDVNKIAAAAYAAAKGDA